MAKTPTQIATSVLNEIGDNSADTDLLTLARGWVQKIYDDIGTRINWQFFYVLKTVTTVAGTPTYDMDVAVRDITSARIQTSHEILEYRPVESLVRNGFNMEDTGVPAFFYWSGFNATTGCQQVGFFPIPNSIKTIEFTANGRPQELVAGDNIPVPTDILTILEEGVLALAHRHEKKWDSYDRVWSNYRNLLEQAVDKYKFPAAMNYVMQVSDIPRRNLGGPVRLPPSRFRN